MKRVIIIAALALVAPFALAAPANARAADYYAPCAGAYVWTKPHTCTLKSGPYGYQQLDLKRIHWRSWGATAYGRGTMVGNMGFRAPVRFKLYRPQRDENGDYIYTRSSGTTFSPYDGARRWNMKLVL